MSETDLNKIIASIDEEMKSEHIPIASRPMHALLRLSKRLQIQITSRAEDKLHNLVIKWFDEKYGDKLKSDHSQGGIAILIRNDLYKMGIPLFYGQARLLSDPNKMSGEKTQISSGSEPMIINVLNLIDGFTAAYAKELSLLELKELILYFKWGLDSFQTINAQTSGTYATAALGDLQSAVYHLFSHPQHCGQSKWASLQATEKFIKSYIEQKGEKAEQHHNLNKLAKHAYTLGLDQLNPDNLEIIQCAAGVRYGELSVNVREAVEAHHASIDICAKVASSA